jgi:predicted nucleic-acid-binding Zn-ribbon protein
MKTKSTCEHCGQERVTAETVIAIQRKRTVINPGLPHTSFVLMLCQRCHAGLHTWINDFTPSQEPNERNT